MRTLLPAALTALLLLAPGAASAELLEAEIDFTNRQGQPERWRLSESVTEDGNERVVRREFRRDGEVFYLEDSRSRDGRLTELLVTDTRPGGESVKVTVEGDRLTFTPLYAGASPRNEAVVGEVLSVGQVAPRLAELLRSRTAFREHRFRVPITKALKTAPMRARIIAIKDESFDVELRSTDFLVQTFFMRGSFRISISRQTGRLIRYEGQPEPYDLSTGSARSVWTAHVFAPAALDLSAAARGAVR